jgi:nucleoside-diphosphate-sugar epimerase
MGLSSGSDRALESMMNNQFAGRLAVVTGGSSGIGLALCEALLQQGARVLSMPRRVAALAGLQRNYPQHLFCQAGDVTCAPTLRSWRVARPSWDRWIIGCQMPVLPSWRTGWMWPRSNGNGR